MNNDSGFLNPSLPILGLDHLRVGDFWQWAYSDILSNRNRSVFAEYIVGVALDVVYRPRVEWDSVDLQYRGFKIEVKSAAYCQSWGQSKPSIIQFSIRKAVFWKSETGAYQGEATRSADLYVFCLYPEQDKSKVNVLDVPAWDLYVISTAILNRDFGQAKSMSLAALRKAAVACKFPELRVIVNRVLADSNLDASIPVESAPLPERPSEPANQASFHRGIRPKVKRGADVAIR